MLEMQNLRAQRHSYLRRQIRRKCSSVKIKPISYQIDDIKFDYNPKDIIKLYITRIKPYKFHINHPLVKFTYLKESQGLYNNELDPIIFLTNCIDNPLKILFHELGHHLYFNFSNDIKIKIITYINNNKKTIKNPLKFLNKCKKFNLRILQKTNPKFYNIICCVLGYGYDEENSLYYSISKLNHFAKARLSSPMIMNSKLESLYYPDEEEIFCEMFAAYMTNNCLHKSNRKFIETLL